MGEALVREVDSSLIAHETFEWKSPQDLESRHSLPEAAESCSLLAWDKRFRA